LKLARCPHSLAPTPRHFTFYVANPISSIPDLWQQEAVRALQQGKDPPSPRLRRDKRGGAGQGFFVRDIDPAKSRTIIAGQVFASIRAVTREILKLYCRRHLS
jgi:hypothetical protein